MDTGIIEKTGNKIKRVDEKELSTPADFTDPAVLYGKLIEAIKAELAGKDTSGCGIIACVPYVDLYPALEAAKGTNIQIGAENCHWAVSGAFTGEVSAEMLKAAGVKTARELIDLLQSVSVGDILGQLNNAEFKSLLSKMFSVAKKLEAKILENTAVMTKESVIRYKVQAQNAAAVAAAAAALVATA